MQTVIVQTAFVCGLSWLIWKVIRRCGMRSTLDNLPGPPNLSFLYGNLPQLYSKQGWDFHKVRLFCCTRKLLYIFDPKAMHAIVVKEQYTYDEARWWLRMNHGTLGPGLLATTGEKHRRQRKMLNPTFNINHMREMVPIFYEVTDKLRQALENSIVDGKHEVDMMSWMNRTALELIGQAGLGHSFDPLVDEGMDPFGNALKSFIPALFSLSGYLHFYNYIEGMVPASLRLLAAELLPHKKFQRLRTIVNTMHEHSVKIYNAKRSALEHGDEALKRQLGEGKDLMSILLRANHAASVEDRLSEEEVIAQMSTLTVTATDTTSNTLSRTLYILAKHPEAQSKLRQELIAAQNGGKASELDYDKLSSLPYLDAVCRETLRLYTPAPFRFRETREDVVLPLSEPIRGQDGKLITAIPLPKDTMVFVGIMSCNTNKALWGEDAYEWKPERWLSPLPATITEAKIPGVYSNLMTFWGGGRACIGFKFSQLEMKVVLSTLISRFNFELTDKTVNWNLAGIVYPTVGNESHPSLPMKVTRVTAEETSID